VIQRRGDSRLAFKPLKSLLVLRQVLGQQFQSDAASQAGYLRFVDYAHPTAPQLSQDSIVRNGLSEYCITGLSSLRQGDHVRGCLNGGTFQKVAEILM